MLRTLALFCAFVVANTLFLPLLWSHWYYVNGPDVAPLSCPFSQSRTKLFVDLQGSDVDQFVEKLSNKDTNTESDITISLTVENFNLQSTYAMKPVYAHTKITRDVFDKWLAEQVDISFSKILQNIGDMNWSPDLVEKDGVSLGAVIASPSKQDPNYFYQWIRDGAITMNTVINYLSENKFYNSTVAETVENYLRNSKMLQRVSNPSGDFDDDGLAGLGEPKFEVNGTPFTGSWGRPQSDGPALRVIAIDNYMKNLEKYGSAHSLINMKDVYDDILRYDLKYICLHWRDSNFDLWEEINSHHFFTSLVQLKALKIGMRLSEEFGDEMDTGVFSQEFSKLSDFIYSEASGYVNHQLSYIVETPSILGPRSGLDAAIVIGSLLTHNDDEDLIPFDVTDGMVLNTLNGLIKSMKFLYPINHSRVNLNLGVGLGRYPEDVYNGNGISEGNPWFLCTLAGAEMMFKVISDLYLAGNDLLIDSTNKNFFFDNMIDGPREFNIRVPYNSNAFNQTMSNLFQFGDSFLDVVREHVADNGAMSEQFNKYTGYMQGAEELTWSHGSLWSANRWRKKALEYI